MTTEVRVPVDLEGPFAWIAKGMFAGVATGPQRCGSVSRPGARCCWAIRGDTGAGGRM